MTFRVPGGFRYAGIACGIKKSGKDDLALVIADRPCAAAGVYTTNLIHAASIDWNRGLDPSRGMRGVVVNSGNANACTGDRGVADNARLASLAAAALDDDPRAFFVMSTGVIGHFLPMEKLEAGIPKVVAELAAGEEAFLRAATGIMTTDAFRKTASKQVEFRGGTVTIAGMCKGAGMIGPKMATMLAVVTTDAAIDSAELEAELRWAADRSFNCISVEGHMSTNDSLVLLASGLVPIAADERGRFREALVELCIELATLIPKDGEGAKHLIEIRVTGAADDTDARRIAEAIANSPLVKTAITGNDPNWGRIVSAAGYAGATFDPAVTRLVLCGRLLFDAGQPTAFDAADTSAAMRDSSTVTIDLSVGNGPGEARHWTSDLTVHYVEFNSEYTT